VVRWRRRSRQAGLLVRRSLRVLRLAWIRLRLRPDRREWLWRQAWRISGATLRAVLLPVAAGARLADRAVSA